MAYSPFFLPHWVQKLPTMPLLPQEQVQGPSGLGLPHWEQNLPVFLAPQEQVQGSGA